MINSLLHSKSLNNILYRYAIVKLSAKKYCLLLNIDHMVSDGETSRIIKKYFDEELDEIIRGLSYKDFIKKYLVANDDHKLKLFEQSKLLKDYTDATKSFNQNYPEYISSKDKKLVFSNPFIIDYSLNNDEKSDDSKNRMALEMVIYIVSKTLGIQFGISTVPIGVLASKHVLNEDNYYFTIGNFNDIIPCTFNTTSDKSYEYYKQYSKTYNQMNKYNLYLGSLATIPRWFNTLYTNNPFSINYLGDYSTTDDKFLKNILKNRVPYPYPIQSYSVNSSILRISFINGIRDEKMLEVKSFLDSLGEQCSYYIE